MNVRQFSDLSDVLISPDKSLESHDSSTGAEEYEDEFEEDFEADSENSRVSDKPSNGNTSTAFQETQSVPTTNNYASNSISVSGSDDDKSNDNLAPREFFEEDALEISHESSSRAIPPRSAALIPTATTSDTVHSTKNIAAVLSTAPVAVADFAERLLVPPVAPKAVIPAELFEATEDLPKRIQELPSNANTHPIPVVHMKANRIPVTSNLASDSETDVRDTELHNWYAKHQTPVRGQSGVKSVPAFSAIRRVPAWEVPGISRSEGHSTPFVPTTAPATVDDKKQLVLTVLELLQAAAKKAEAQREAELAAKSARTVCVPSFQVGGLQRAQALAAAGKFFIERVPDYDPDFEPALQFLRETDEDREAEIEHDSTRRYEAQAQWERDMGGSDGSPPENLQARSHGSDSAGKLPSDQSSIQSPALDMSHRSHDFRAVKTFPQATRSKDATQAVHGSTRHKQMPSTRHTKSPHSSPSDTNKENYVHSASSSTSRSKMNDKSPSLAAEQSSTPGSHTGGALQVPSSPDSIGSPSSVPTMPLSGGWPVPLLRRVDVMSGVPIDRSTQLHTSCENLYAAFLSDLISCCKRRASECNNTIEMAMLKALSDHVFATFASGDKLEDVQCKMLRGALAVPPTTVAATTNTAAVVKAPATKTLKTLPVHSHK